MIVSDLDDFMMLNIKVVGYGCFVCNMIKNDGINRLNNSKLDDKATL